MIMMNNCCMSSYDNVLVVSYEFVYICLMNNCCMSCYDMLAVSFDALQVEL